MCTCFTTLQNNTLTVSSTHLTTLSAHNNLNKITFYFQYNVNLASLFSNHPSIVFSLLCTNHYKILFNPYFFQNYLIFNPLKIQIFNSYLLLFRKRNVLPKPFLFVLNQRKKPMFGTRKKLYIKNNNIIIQSQIHGKTNSVKVIKLLKVKKTNNKIQLYKDIKKTKTNKTRSILMPWRQYFKFISQRREHLFNSYICKARRFKKFTGLPYSRAFSRFFKKNKRWSKKKGRKHILFNRTHKIQRFRSRIKYYSPLNRYLTFFNDLTLLKAKKKPVIKNEYVANPVFYLFHKLFFNNQYKILTPLLRASPNKFDLIRQPINMNQRYNWRRYNYTKKARKRLIFLKLLSTLKRNIKILSYLQSPKLSINHSINVRRKKIISNKRRRYSLPRQYLFLNCTKPSFIKFRPIKTILLRRMIRFYKRHLNKIKNTGLKSIRRSRNYRYTWKKRTLAQRVRRNLRRYLPLLVKTERSISIKKLSRLLSLSRPVQRKFLRLFIKTRARIFLRENKKYNKSRISLFLLNFKNKHRYLYSTKVRMFYLPKKNIQQSLKKSSFKYALSTPYYIRKTFSKNSTTSESNLRFIKNRYILPIRYSKTNYKFPLRLNYYKKNRKMRLLRHIASVKTIKIRTKSLLLPSHLTPKFLRTYRLRLTRRLRRQLRQQHLLFNRKQSFTLGYKVRRVITKISKKTIINSQKWRNFKNRKLQYRLSNSANRALSKKLAAIIRCFNQSLRNLPMDDLVSYQQENETPNKDIVGSQNYENDSLIEEGMIVQDTPIVMQNLPNQEIQSNNNVAGILRIKPGRWYTLLFAVWRSRYIKAPFNIKSSKNRSLLQSKPIYYNNRRPKQNSRKRAAIEKQLRFTLILTIQYFYKYSKYIEGTPTWKKTLLTYNTAFSDWQSLYTDLNLNYNQLNSTSIFTQPINSTFLFTIRNKFSKSNANVTGKFYVNSKHSTSGLFLLSRYKSPFILSYSGFLFIQTVRTQNSQLMATKINKHRYSFFYKNDIKRFYLRNTSHLKLINTIFDNSTNHFDTSPSLNWKSLSILTNSFTNLVNAPKDNSMEITGLIRSTIGTNLVNSTQHLVTYPFQKPIEPPYYEMSVKRIKFKPGYSRIWRKSREAINFSLKFNARYQYRLTRWLHNLKKVTKGEASRLLELTLLKFLLNARFVLDLSSSALLLQNNLVFVNGSLCSNPHLHLFKGDFIQLAVSLKYYIVYRWLYNYNFQHKLRLHKLSKSKWNKSRVDISKQKSSHLPDWIFLVGYRHFDIPRYMEVDYFTLSAFILYDSLVLTDYNPLTFLECRNEILNMYNWKYIV